MVSLTSSLMGCVLSTARLAFPHYAGIVLMVCMWHCFVAHTSSMEMEHLERRSRALEHVTGLMVSAARRGMQQVLLARCTQASTLQNGEAIL